MAITVTSLAVALIMQVLVKTMPHLASSSPSGSKDKAADATATDAAAALLALQEGPSRNPELDEDSPQKGGGERIIAYHIF